jgi:hypothetical protein
MKRGKLLKLVLVCTLLSAGLLGGRKPADAFVCPNNGWACNTAANCGGFCDPSQLTICNRAHCCWCV